MRHAPPPWFFPFRYSFTSPLLHSDQCLHHPKLEPRLSLSLAVLLAWNPLRLPWQNTTVVHSETNSPIYQPHDHGQMNFALCASVSSSKIWASNGYCEIMYTPCLAPSKSSTDASCCCCYKVLIPVHHETLIICSHLHSNLSVFPHSSAPVVGSL